MTATQESNTQESNRDSIPTTPAELASLLAGERNSDLPESVSPTIAAYAFLANKFIEKNYPDSNYPDSNYPNSNYHQMLLEIARELPGTLCMECPPTRTSSLVSIFTHDALPVELRKHGFNQQADDILADPMTSHDQTIRLLQETASQIMGLPDKFGGEHVDKFFRSAIRMAKMAHDPSYGEHDPMILENTVWAVSVAYQDSPDEQRSAHLRNIRKTILSCPHMGPREQS